MTGRCAPLQAKEEKGGQGAVRCQKEKDGQGAARHQEIWARLGRGSTVSFRTPGASCVGKLSAVICEIDA